jgi:hypothetical protein
MIVWWVQRYWKKKLAGKAYWEDYAKYDEKWCAENSSMLWNKANLEGHKYRVVRRVVKA